MLTDIKLSFPNQRLLTKVMTGIIDVAPDTRDHETGHRDETQRAKFYAEVARRCQTLADSYDV